MAKEDPDDLLQWSPRPIKPIEPARKPASKPVDREESPGDAASEITELEISPVRPAAAPREEPKRRAAKTESVPPASGRKTRGESAAWHPSQSQTTESGSGSERVRGIYADSTRSESKSVELPYVDLEAPGKTPEQIFRERLFQIAVVCGTLMLLFAILSYVFTRADTIEAEIPGDLMKRVIERNFPVEAALPPLINLKVLNPQFTLIEGNDFIPFKAKVHVVVQRSLDREDFYGELEGRCGLKYVNNQRRFYVTMGRMHSLVLEGAGSGLEGQVRVLVTDALIDFFNTRPVYALHASQIPGAEENLKVLYFVVRDGDLSVTLDGA